MRVDVGPVRRAHAGTARPRHGRAPRSRDPAGAEVLETNLAAARRPVKSSCSSPAMSRAVEQTTAVALCAKAFGTRPDPRRDHLPEQGNRRRRSRCAGRIRSDRRDRTGFRRRGFDVIHVTLRKADLERIPESRIHTALEASLNCEVHIRLTFEWVSRHGIIITRSGSFLRQEFQDRGRGLHPRVEHVERLHLSLRRASRRHAPRRPRATAGRSAWSP